MIAIFDSLKEAKQVDGVLTGKQGGNAIFVPSIYSKGQSEWVNNFYKQNGYLGNTNPILSRENNKTALLEYSSLARLGISEPQGFIKRHFPSEKILYLPSCAVGSLLFDQVEASIEDAVSSGTFIDLMVTEFYPSKNQIH